MGVAALLFGLLGFLLWRTVLGEFLVWSGVLYIIIRMHNG